MPNALESEKSALHAFDSDPDGDEFVTRCNYAGLCVRKASSDAERNVRKWIDLDSLAYLSEVPEFPFNPARLAGRLVAFARHNGAKVLINHHVGRIITDKKEARVYLANGRVESGACVVNMAGRAGRAPSRWRVMQSWK